MEGVGARERWISMWLSRPRADRPVSTCFIGQTEPLRGLTAVFRTISLDEFDELLASAPTSPAFREEFARYDFGHDRQSIDAAVHDGPLHVTTAFRTPAFCTLIIGDLDVAREIDLRSSYECGGLFIVLGDVRCEHFIGEYEAAVFIDGDLQAGGAVLIAYSDSSFSVIGSMRARLLIGNDMCASVGSGAILDDGIGYCASLGSEGTSGIVKPRYDRNATIEALIPKPRESGYPFDADDLAGLIRAGEPIFR
jgi:hypothetical protein